MVMEKTQAHKHTQISERQQQQQQQKTRTQIIDTGGTHETQHTNTWEPSTTQARTKKKTMPRKNKVNTYVKHTKHGPQAHNTSTKLTMEKTHNTSMHTHKNHGPKIPPHLPGFPSASPGQPPPASYPSIPDTCGQQYNSDGRSKQKKGR